MRCGTAPTFGLKFLNISVNVIKIQVNINYVFVEETKIEIVKVNLKLN